LFILISTHYSFMKFSALLKFSFENLVRSKLRTVLTILGVMIGSAALVAMIAYGVGLQKTFSDEFSDLELFSTVRVTSSSFDVSDILSYSKKAVRNLNENQNDNFIRLDDSILTVVKKAVHPIFPDAMVYPETVFPCKISIDTFRTAVICEALPAGISKYKGYNQLKVGRFFQSDSTNEVVISEILLNRMGVEQPDQALGKAIKVTTVSWDFSKLMSGGFLALMGMADLPVREYNYNFKIVGVISDDVQKLSSGFKLIMPITTAKNMKRMHLMSSVSLLKQSNQKGGYTAIVVRTENQKQSQVVKDTIKAIGLNASSFTDSFNQFKKLFLVFDLALAIVGMIALVVATLGITNTMIMSIMERYREIGIMKALGASDEDIRQVFLVESAIIGFVGGIGGVLLGKFVTVFINKLVNIYVIKQAGTVLAFFHFPFWLVLSAVIFSVLISTIAGLYPANRAAKIQPVEALRYN